MPLDQDPGKGGIEKDGTHSSKWCSLCYKDGAFTGKDCTLEEMKKIVDDAMKKQGMNWIMRTMAMMQLPHLKRWKQADTSTPL